MIWQIAWNTSAFENIWLVYWANTLLLFLVIDKCIRTSLACFCSVIPIFWSVTFNAGSIWKIWFASRTDASTTQFLIDKSVRTPLTLFCLWIPKVRFITFYASTVVFIWSFQWTNTFVDLFIINESSRTFLALFGLLIPEKWFVTSETNLISFIWRIDRTSTFSKRNIVNVSQRTCVTWSSLFVPKIRPFTINTSTVFVQKRSLLRASTSSLELIISKSRWTKLAFSWCTVIIRSCRAFDTLVSIPQWSIDGAIDTSLSIWIEISIFVTALTFSGVSIPISRHVTRNTVLSCTVWQVWWTNALLLVCIEGDVWIVVFELRTGVYCYYKYEQKKDMAFLIHIAYQFI